MMVELSQSTPQRFTNHMPAASLSRLKIYIVVKTRNPTKSSCLMSQAAAQF